MSLSWGKIRCLENSLVDFLNAELVTDTIKDINGTQIVARVGRKEDNDWNLPVITAYVDNISLPKLFVGENTTLNTYLIVIDIYATNEGERIDLAQWVEDNIKNGFRYYTYTPNVSNPNSPTKVAGRLIGVTFVTNTRVALGQNVDLIDAHRHRITINCDINGT